MAPEYSNLDETNLDETKKKKRSKLDRFLNRLPYYFSFVILISTWILFMLFITLGEVLLKRGEIGRFIEQAIIYNSLLFLTLISLLTTANRSPGTPDQSLAPPISPSAHRHRASQAEIQHHEEEDDDDDDDVPLRFLKNAQWVNTRIGKDRPSPLPIPANRRYPPTSNDRPFTARSEDTNDKDDCSESEYLPFPLSAKSPFVPTTAIDAGEDDEDNMEDSQFNNDAEGSGINGEEASISLLRSHERTENRVDGDRSLMAKSNNGEVRWCKKCKGWKPDRCHHCRHCEQCVLKMDHHCPWVGTCVGYHNYKPFFLFINYALLLAIYATFEAGYETYRFFQDPSGAVPYRPVQMDDNENVTDTASIAAADEWSDGLGISPAIFMMLTIMGGFMSLAMGGLVCFHWYLMLNNQTTLENITHAYPSALLDEVPSNAQWKADHLLTRSERNRLKWEAREINVYDLGWRQNIKNLFFGEKKNVTACGVIIALWPTGRPNRYDRRSGHFFDFNRQHFEKLRDLTLELRYGIKRNAEGKTRKSSHESSEGEAESWSVGGRNSEEGFELDGLGEKGDVQGEARGSKVKWFEV